MEKTYVAFYENSYTYNAVVKFYCIVVVAIAYNAECGLYSYKGKLNKEQANFSVGTWYLDYKKLRIR